MADYDATLQALLNAQRREPTIIKLSEPISGHLKATAGAVERTSDVSADVLENPTPASLEADLEHYKELFSKLRFSYLEQVTKEKFIRAIVDDPPLIVEHQENVELEKKLAGSKAALKRLKTEVADLVSDLDKRGRDLGRRYEVVRGQTIQLQELPKRLEKLQQSIQTLKEGQRAGADPNYYMPLEKTRDLVDQRRKEKAELDRQLEHLQTLVPRKTRDLERMNAELQPLEIRSLGSTASAREARRRKEAALGGVEDDLEERGRWWRGVESGLKGMLAVEN